MATQETDSCVEELFAAIKINNTASVKSLLEQRCDLVNVKSSTKWGAGTSTPLMEACNAGSKELVQMLLDKGADISATGHLIEFAGVNYANVDIYDGGYGTFDDIFPLYITTKHIQIEIVEEILQAGACINQTNALGQSALHVAVKNYDGSDPLRNYLSYGLSEEKPSMQVFKKLIDNGANVNLQDHNGKTPLHYACANANQYMVELLLAKQANINFTDNNGLTALEIASHTDFKITETIIEKSDLNVQQIIEAYETSASLSSCQSPYEALYKATQLRMTHNIPKVPLEPMECYDFHKEFETLEQLQRLKSDGNQLRLQSILAGERIFHGRYVSFLKSETDKIDIFKSNKSHLNTLLRHHLKIFCQNDDYLYFTGFIAYSRILSTLLYPALRIDQETPTVFMEVSLLSCHKLQKALEIETKPGTIQQMISQLEQSLFTLGSVIMHLLKEEQNSENNDNSSSLAAELYRNLWQEIPWVVSPVSGCKTPLPHVLFNNRYDMVYSLSELCAQSRYNLMKIIIDSGFCLNATDADGNTLLHVIISSLPNDFTWWHRPLFHDAFPVCLNATRNIVHLLLEEGAYLHARNKRRKTVMDLLQEPSFTGCYRETDIVDILSKYDQFPKLKHLAAIQLRQSNIPYQDKLPVALVQFVDLH